MPTALPDESLDRILRSARTFNGFTDAPFSRDDARAVWDLMKWGPTSANQEPARLVWCLTQDAKDKLAAFCSESNAGKVRAAPAAVVVAHDLEFHEKLPVLFPHADAKSWFPDEGSRQVSAFRNGTLQGAYLFVAARALGFDVGPMSGFDNARVDAAFFAGTTWRSNFIVTIGVGDRSTLHPRLPRLSFEDANEIA